MRGSYFLATGMLLTVCTFLAAVSTSPARADEVEATHTEHEFARNELGLFLGATTGEDETAFTVGATYEFRPLDYLGLGVVAEYVGGEMREWIWLLPVISHPNRDAEGGWKLLIGPGFEYRESGNDFLIRLGISYGFPVSGWTISPEFHGDLVHGEWSWVYGLEIGRGF